MEKVSIVCFKNVEQQAQHAIAAGAEVELCPNGEGRGEAHCMIGK